MCFLVVHAATAWFYSLSLRDALPISGGLAFCLLEVVGGEDDGAPGGGDAAHLVPEGAAGADVHADGGFVQQQHLGRSEEHTSELQSRGHLVCRLLLEKK